MATLYQKNMNKIDTTKIDNIFDTINMCFIPLDNRSPYYKNVLDYCSELGITINDLDIYPG